MNVYSSLTIRMDSPRITACNNSYKSFFCIAFRNEISLNFDSESRSNNPVLVMISFWEPLVTLDELLSDIFFLLSLISISKIGMSSMGFVLTN